MERLSKKLKNVLDNCIDSISEFQQDILDEAINFLSNAENILGDDYDLDRLRDLVEADKDGRCVMMPCKNGDKVWYITSQQEVCDARVTGIWLNIYTNPQMWLEITYFSELTGQGEFKNRVDLALNKTVFLNQEAAEAALKGEQHECN